MSPSLPSRDADHTPEMAWTPAHNGCYVATCSCGWKDDTLHPHQEAAASAMAKHMTDTFLRDVGLGDYVVSSNQEDRP